MEKIEQLKKIINETNQIVFFGGAGVSTESMIPDFRGNHGLYQKRIIHILWKSCYLKPFLIIIKRNFTTFI